MNVKGIQFEGFAAGESGFPAPTRAASEPAFECLGTSAKDAEVPRSDEDPGKRQLFNIHRSRRSKRPPYGGLSIHVVAQRDCRNTGRSLEKVSNPARPW